MTPPSFRFTGGVSFIFWDIISLMSLMLFSVADKGNNLSIISCLSDTSFSKIFSLKK